MGKLVRDKVPDIIKQSGKTPIYHSLSDNTFFECLLDKLVEEANEVKENPSKEELADVLEVIDALVDLLGLSAEQLNEFKNLKKKTNGSFSKRYYLDDVK